MQSPFWFPLICDREGENECSALAGFAADFDDCAMIAHDPARDAEAEAAAARLGGIKWFEDSVQVLGRDARAGIAQFDPDVRSVIGRVDADRALGRSRFDGVEEQVEEGQFELDTIPLDSIGDGLKFRAKNDVLGCARAFDAAERVRKDFVKPHARKALLTLRNVL